MLRRTRGAQCEPPCPGGSVFVYRHSGAAGSHVQTDWPVRSKGARSRRMSNFMSFYLVPAAIAAVAVVLLLGLVNMMRGGSPNRSQKLMRLRVLLQFVAIIIIMATIWVMGR